MKKNKQILLILILIVIILVIYTLIFIKKLNSKNVDNIIVNENWKSFKVEMYNNNEVFGQSKDTNLSIVLDKENNITICYNGENCEVANYNKEGKIYKLNNSQKLNGVFEYNSDSQQILFTTEENDDFYFIYYFTR